MRAMRALVWLSLGGLLSPLPSVAGEPVIEDVAVEASRGGSFYFSVTVRHDDTGWSHYADKWVVLAPDGETVITERVLTHPHVDEQPFTRGVRVMRIPSDIKEVRIRVHDIKHGWGSEDFTVTIPGR